ncbi:MAG: hypothetical protein R3F61_25540 [Myxococcota bacterium]
MGERVLLGRGALRSSANPYDWLGEGVYFWERSERRALQWAHEQVGRGKVREPFVLGAYLHLGRCLDLTDTEQTARLSDFYDDYVRTMEDVGRPLAENKAGRSGGDDLLVRFLDCAVLNLGLRALDEAAGDGGVYFQTVRGVFVEGPAAYPGAAIRTKTHVQICVRDPASILGFFKPVGYDGPEGVQP